MLCGAGASACQPRTGRRARLGSSPGRLRSQSCERSGGRRAPARASGTGGQCRPRQSGPPRTVCHRHSRPARFRTSFERDRNRHRRCLAKCPRDLLSSGRILEVHARLGDTVTRGQLLLRVQSADTSSAFSDYRQAVADETLARAQLARSKLLYDKGAIAQKDLEVTQDVADKARITVENTSERLRVLGADRDHPSPVVDILAPVSGVITDQQVTAASGTQGLASPNALTISDLSHVWVVCDVYENDLAFVHLDEYAEIRLNAFPDKVLKGRVSNIGPTLDPNLRTAKVRLEVQNPGFIRLGMFVKATFHGQNREVHTMVPATAVLHLHDRDWVYLPTANGQFRRVEVTGGDMLPGNMQEIRTGIQPGQRVVQNALVLQNTEGQ